MTIFAPAPVAGDGGTWDLDQDRDHNEVNEIDDIDGGAWEDPLYDAAGNTFYAGWPSGPSLWSFYDEEDWCFYKYDAWNRLVEVYTYPGGPPCTFGKYYYDGLPRRIWRIVDGFGYPNRTDYYYNTDWQVLEERFYDGEDPETTVATDVTCQYVWDTRYIDAPICRDKDVDDDDDCTETDWDTGDDPDEHLYYCQDANFNTTALVERSDGTVLERYVYDPYGKVTIYDDDWSDTVTWGNSKTNAYLYSGYRYDHETRLYHVRHRSYHPTLGRWMQRDPIGYADGMGLYEYIACSPPNRRDPTGQVMIEGGSPGNPGRTFDGLWRSERTKVRLEVAVVSAGGSIELRPGGAQVAMVGAGPVVTVRNATNRTLHWVDADIEFSEFMADTMFLAKLRVSVSAGRARGWQICPAWRWTLKVHNVCCLSERVLVRTVSMADPTARAVVPAEGVFPLPLGGEPLSLSPDTELKIIQMFTKKDKTLRRTFESSASVLVVVECMP